MSSASGTCRRQVTHAEIAAGVEQKASLYIDGLKEMFLEAVVFSDSLEKGDAKLRDS